MIFQWQENDIRRTGRKNGQAGEAMAACGGRYLVDQSMTDREFLAGLQRYHTRICNMIFHMDIEWIDIEIQINEMREFCREHCPDRLELFEMIYPNRFRRLFESWGPESRVG